MLSVLREAFRDDDAACSLPVFHAVMLFARNQQVTAAKDIFVYGPNGVGLALGIVQLTLKLLFPSKA